MMINYFHALIEKKKKMKKEVNGNTKMLFTWQSSADSPLEILNPNTFLRLIRHGSVLIYCCLLYWWPWHSTLLLLTKHWHISLPLWQLHWDLDFFLKLSKCLSSSLKGILGGGKCRDHGLLKPNIHGAEQSTNLLSETRIWLPHSAYRTPNTCRHWSMNYRLKTNKMIQLWIFSLSCI